MISPLKGMQLHGLRALVGSLLINVFYAGAVSVEFQERRECWCSQYGERASTRRAQDLDLFLELLACSGIL